MHNNWWKNQPNERHYEERTIKMRRLFEAKLKRFTFKYVFKYKYELNGIICVHCRNERLFWARCEAVGLFFYSSVGRCVIAQKLNDHFGKVMFSLSKQRQFKCTHNCWLEIKMSLTCSLIPRLRAVKKGSDFACTSQLSLSASVLNPQ